jgi:hypothetical protein
MSRRIRWFAVLLLVCGVSAGCARSAATEEIGGDPAVVTPVKGPGNLHRIQLTADGAKRIGLQTDTVRTVPATAQEMAANAQKGGAGTQKVPATAQKGGAGTHLVVANAAVLYDQDGATWVYAETGPLTFQRVRVTISGTTGDLAILRSGPAVGTTVATVGAAELRGSEDGVPGE